MANLQARQEPIVWRRESIPAGSNVWVFKVNHHIGVGTSRIQYVPGLITVRIVASGAGIVQCDGREYHVKPGTVSCALPGELFGMVEAVDDPWEWYEFQITGAGAMDVVRAICCSNAARCIDAWKPAAAIAGFRQMYDAFAMDERSPHAVMSLLHKIIDACRAWRDETADDRSSRNILVERARAAVESSLTPDVNVSQLTQRLGVNRTTLLRAFREKLGMTPSAFLSEMRLKRARNLLTLTELSITQIAAAAGYSGVRQFIHCFRNAEGMSPGRWRATRKPPARSADGTSID